MWPTSHSVVLVAVASTIDPGCDDALREMEQRGYPVWRVCGYVTIDSARNQMASGALAQDSTSGEENGAKNIFNP